MGKSSAHIRYKTKEGIVVPGVSTITNLLSKPALIIWANRLGLQGVDSTKFRDEKADIGTLAHKMILDYFKKQETDTSEYSKVQIDQAENSMLSFWAWEKQHKVEPLVIEEPFVSDIHKFGGTCDFFGKVDGEFELLDFKTGSGIYKEMWYQVSGYYWLLKEDRNITLSRARILNIPRTEDESFKEEVKDEGSVSKYLQGFLTLVEFYHNDKEIGK